MLLMKLMKKREAVKIHWPQPEAQFIKHLCSGDRKSTRVVMVSKKWWTWASVVEEWRRVIDFDYSIQYTLLNAFWAEKSPLWLTDKDKPLKKAFLKSFSWSNLKLKPYHVLSVKTLMAQETLVMSHRNEFKLQNEVKRSLFLYTFHYKYRSSKLLKII